MRTSTPALLPLFRSELQLRILALLLLNPERDWTAKELREATNAPAASIHRELQRAFGAGILIRDSVGRTLRYKAAAQSPLFDPLQTLLRRTVGVEIRLREALSDSEGIEVAALHGSRTRGDVSPRSDVDLLVVGDIDPGRLLRMLRSIERETGQTIDFVVMTPAEYRRRLAEGNGFLIKLAQGPRNDLVGDLERLGDG